MILQLDQVTCSLNLGYIYSVDYSFDPKTGVKIILFFTNESGIFPFVPTVFNNNQNCPMLSALVPCHISIGGADFIVYPVTYTLQQSNDKKILKVEFIDSNFLLDNYYIVLTGRGCGPNTFPLGIPFQYLNPTSEEEQRRWLLQQYTSFVDLEYFFFDFINVLQKIFPVTVNANVDTTIQRAFTGNFREVLDAWCGYLNLSYFFENNQLFIYDPLVLQSKLVFPSVPGNALSSEFTESLVGTYSKVSSIFIESDGGQFNLSYPLGVYDCLTLFPVGSQFGDPPITIDNNQVIASMFGKQFYFLYNYYNQIGATTIDLPALDIQANYYPNIGTTDLPLGIIQNSSLPILNSLNQSNVTNVINFDEGVFDAQFAMYNDYGTKVAGRFYQSDDVGDFTQFAGFTFQNDGGQVIKLDEFSNPDNQNPPPDDIALIQQTVQGGFPGLLSNGNARYIYYDNSVRDTGVFMLSPDQQSTLNDTYNAIVQGFEGARGLDVSSLGLSQVAAFTLPTQPSFINDLFVSAVNNFSLDNIFNNYPVKGYKPITPINQPDPGPDKLNNYFPSSLNITSSAPPPPSNPTINQQGSFLVRQNGEYVAYFPKYGQCIFTANAVGTNVLNNRYVNKTESVDVPVRFKMTPNGYGTSYTLTRDLSIIASNVWQQETNNSCGARTFTAKSVSFTLNYFIDIPANYITNGFVGLTVEVNERGILATYNYSNSMVGVNESEAIVDKIERSIRNSIKRQYWLDHLQGFQ
jgi:hypothetical protein